MAAPRRTLGVAAVLLCLAASAATPVAGPFEILLDHAEPCPPAMLDTPFVIRVRLVRNRRSPQIWSIFANYTAHFSFDDDKDAHLVLASWNSRGGWKDNAVVMKIRRLCLSTKTYLPRFWDQMLRVSYGPRGALLGRDCPFEPGEYYVYNASSALLRQVETPVMFYGKWRADAKVVDSRTRKRVACMRVFVSIVPKQATTPG